VKSGSKPDPDYFFLKFFYNFFWIQIWRGKACRSN